MISRESIEEIKEKARLIEVAADYLELKVQSNRYMALCPFHAEKTPSFHIRDDYNTYHCFGCGASGNVISFLMELRGITFIEAVEDLASRYNIELKRQKGRGGASTEQLKKDIFRLNALAVLFFQDSLRKSPQPVKDYLRERAIRSESIATFKLGFAPSSKDSLYRFLRSKGAPDDVINASGLIRRNERGECYDTFRSRLIFPILLDPRRVAGFGGRIIPALVEGLDASRIPKYLNSSETPVYEKSRILYGIPQSLGAIREEKSACIVEGYMDVLSLWQSGCRNAVATCGTALTAGHLANLSRLARRVTVLFDGDSAGRTAAAKAFQVFINSSIDVKAAFLDPEDDPDTVSRKYGDRVSAYLESLPKVDLVECFISMLASNAGAASIREVPDALLMGIAQELASVLSKIEEPIVCERMTRSAAHKASIRAELLSDLVKQKQAKNDERRLSSVDLAVSESTAASGPEAPSSLESAKIENLQRVSREMLKALMVLRGSAIEKVLSDAELVEALEPEIVLFIQGLSEISEEASDGARKAMVKELLSAFDSSWLNFWKEAHAMAASSDSNFEGLFADCCLEIKKNKLKQRLRELDEQPRAISEEQELSLIQERIILKRRLASLETRE